MMESTSKTRFIQGQPSLTHTSHHLVLLPITPPLSTALPTSVVYCIVASSFLSPWINARSTESHSSELSTSNMRCSNQRHQSHLAQPCHIKDASCSHLWAFEISMPQSPHQNTGVNEQGKPVTYRARACPSWGG